MASQPISVVPLDTTQPKRMPTALRARREKLEANAATQEQEAPAFSPPPQHAPASFEGEPLVSPDTPPPEATVEYPLAQAAPVRAAPVQAAPVQAAPVSFGALFGEPVAEGDTTPAATPTAANKPAPREDAQTRADMAELKAQVARLTESLAAQASAPAPRSAPAFAEASLTPDEMETYRDSLPIINKVVAANLSAHTEAMRAEHAAQIQALRDDVETNIGSLQSGVKTLRSTSYDQQRALLIPDLEVLVNRPEFAAYVATPIAFSGSDTISSRLRAAHIAGNLPQVVEIMNDFRAKVGGATPESAASRMSGMMQPASSAAPSATDGAVQSQAVLRWSDRQTAFREMRAGRVTRADFEKLDAAFRLAESAGQIDYNA